MALDTNRPKNYKRAWNRGRDLVKEQRTAMDMYIAGVEIRRGKLTAKERDEVRYAWMAGMVYATNLAYGSARETGEKS